MAEDLLQAIKQREMDRQSKSLETVYSPGKASLADRIQQREVLRKQGISVPEPEQIDVMQRRTALAGQVGETGLAEPGFKGFGDRADIGLSDTFEEKREKFISKFPDGDFVQVNDPSGGRSVLFRKNQNEPFAEFDAPLLDAFVELGDVADLSAEVPATALELMVVRGGGLVKQMFRLFGATVAGEGLKETAEELRGFQKEEILPILERSIAKGAISVAGGTFTTLVSGPLNAFRGAGKIKLAPGAPRAQKAATKLDVPPLLPQQVALNPIIRKIGNQAQQTTTNIREYVNRQQAASVRAILRLRDRDAARFIRGDLAALHKDSEKQILSALKVNRTDLTKGGTAIQAGIAEYDDLARATVNGLYKTARAIEDPQFNLAGMADMATEVKVLAEELGPDGGGVLLLANDMLRLSLDDAGAPAAFIAARETVLPSGDDIVMSATDRIRHLRSRAHGLKTPAPGDIARAQERLAGKLFGALDRTLKTPKNANPDFLGAWSVANAEASSRFATMEKIIIRQAMLSETPAQMAHRLAQPRQVDNLAFLKDTIPESQYRIFQDAAKTDFIDPRNAPGLSRRLNSFDKETLDAMFSEADQVALRDIGQKIDRLEALNIPGIQARQSRDLAMVQDLIVRKDTAALDTLVQSVRRNPNSRAGRSIRAGVVESVYDKVVKISPESGVAQISNTALRAEVDALRKSGAIKLLTPGDIHVLNNLDRITRFLPETADTGASLQSGEVAAGIRGLSAKAFITLLENIGTGRLFTSKIGQRWFLGSGATAAPFSKLRVMGAALAQAVTDVEKEGEAP
jgi:hypothetical protein